MKIELIKHTELSGNIYYSVVKQEGNTVKEIYKTFGQDNAQIDAVAAFLSAKKGYPKKEVILEAEI